MDATKICFMALMLIPRNGNIALIQSLKIIDKELQSALVLLSRDACALSDLVKQTGGNIIYCDNTDGSTVPNSHWCDATRQEESRHNTRLTYRCEDGVWRREVGTGIDVYKGYVRNKRADVQCQNELSNAYVASDFQSGFQIASAVAAFASVVFSIAGYVRNKRARNKRARNKWARNKRARISNVATGFQIASAVASVGFLIAGYVRNKRADVQCQNELSNADVASGFQSGFQIASAVAAFAAVVFSIACYVRNKRASISNVAAGFQIASAVATFASVGFLVACYFTTCSKGAQESRPAPPTFETCPPVEINAQTIYYAPPGQNSAIVVWTEPKSIGTEVQSSLSCCGNYKSGDSFLGSFSGTNYFMTYTVKDKHGQNASCSFKFTIFYLACEEPSPSTTRIKQRCTHGLLYGSECTFGCIEGYSITDGFKNSSMCEKESGTTVKWSTLPECEKIRCTPPVAPSNGKVSCRSPQYAYDTECIFSCNDGYRLSGPSTVYCQSDRSWSIADVNCTDDDPPIITCSSHVIYADRGSLTANVFWSEPLVTDNVDNDLKANKLSNISQGDLLQEGTHFIPYRAIDSEGNSHPMLSECNITVQVQVIKCASGPTESLNNTRFLRYNCSDSVYYIGVQCYLFCDLNLEVKGTHTLSCERNGTFGLGVWEWDGDVEPHCNVVKCPPLAPPANGAMTYDSVNARPLHVMLCQSGYDSPVVGSSFTGRLSCQDSGTWYPLDAFPNCIKSSWANMAVLVDLIYEGNCNSSGIIDVIKLKVLRYLSQIQDDIYKSICPGKDCKVDNLVVVCGSNRRRRSSSITSESNITKRHTSNARVTFDISTPFILSNATADEAYDELFPLLESISRRIAVDIANGSLDIDCFTLDTETFQTNPNVIFKCPTNLKKDGFKCKPCPKGTYMNSTTRNCELCNIGKYNEEDGRSHCDLCPPDHSTLKTGSTHQSECTRYCDPGFASSTGMVPCFACPLGSYQP
ncbi:hypothetical protein DPMN_068512 [Dreissena polymorpha]|uniref:Sushi, von Willebrand factor type A, EGF and pentraxin domain-containing protein 1 n=1 Tax=Dreissena polymorpha TaxID=45954 RepID=A0A9D4BUB8_DREPO|nr:hypothetical protein DPMN_068512 [Dreissena polymorpha]